MGVGLNLSRRIISRKGNLLKIGIIAFILMSFTSLWAQTTYYSILSTTGNWNNANSWDTDSLGTGGAGIPAAGDIAVIQNSSIIQVDISTSLDSISVKSGGTLRFLSSAGNFTITLTGGVLNAGTIDVGTSGFAFHTLEIGGYFNNSTGSLVTSNGGTRFLFFDFTGSGVMQISGAAVFYYLIQSGTGTLSTGSGLITVTSEFDLQSNSGGFTVGSGGLTIEASTINIYGDSFDATTNDATLTFQGSSAKIIDVDGLAISILNFYNCIIQGADVTLLATNDNVDFRINNKLTLTDKKFIFSTSGADESISYTSGATLEYNGSSSQVTDIEWTSSITQVNVTINNPTTVQISGTGTLGDRTIAGNLTLTQGSLIHSDSGRTLTVGGNIIGGNGAYGVSTRGTLVLNGVNSTAITISESFTVGNLNVNKASRTTTVTVFAGGILKLDKGSGSANSVFNITQGTFVFNEATQLSRQGSGTGSHTLSIGANGILRTGGVNITAFNSYSLANGKVVFSGTTIETMPTGISIDTVEVDNTAGVQPGNGTLTINNGLILTNGIITTTSSRILRLGSSATISGTPDSTKMIVGPLQKNFTADASFFYPVGTGTKYRPANFEYNGASFSGTSTVEIEFSTSTFTPKSPTSPITLIDDQSHYIVKEVGSAPSTISYYFTGTFEDVNFNPESSNRALVETTSSYLMESSNSVNTTNNTVTSGLFDVFPVGDFRIVFGREGSVVSWVGGASGSWFTGSNWSSSNPPTNSDYVEITGNVAVSIDGSGSAEANTITIGDGANTTSLSITTSSSTPLTIYDTGSTALIVRKNATLFFNNTDSIIFGVGGNYEPSRTDMRIDSNVEYQQGLIPIDIYSNLIINGATGTAGNGFISVGRNLTKQSSTAFAASDSISVGGNYTNTLGDATFSAGLRVNGSTFTLTSGALDGTLTINSPTITVNGGSFSGSVFLAGSSTQTIGGSVTPSFSNLTISNANGITGNVNIDVTTDLNLANGVFATGSNTLVLGSSAGVTGGSATSYVDGNLANTYNTTSAAKVFPLGNSGRYRMVELTGSANTGTTLLTGALVNQNATNVTTGLDVNLERVSLLRYYSFSNAGNNAQITEVTAMRVNDDDGVGDLNPNTTLRIATTVGTGGTWNERTLTSDPDTRSQSLPVDIVSNTFTESVNSPAILYVTLATSDIADNSLPVQLSAFTADLDFDRVTLKWITSSELQNEGFHLYKRTAATEEWNRINPQLIAGQGNTSSETSYEFVDRVVAAGQKYEYMLESISYAGVRVAEKILEVNVPVPTDYSLEGNYPNPFNPSTRIRFQLPEHSAVSLIIYDIRGNLVNKLAYNQAFEAGAHELTWNAVDDAGRPVSSGMYVYRFAAGTFQKTGKMIFLK